MVNHPAIMYLCTRQTFTDDTTCRGCPKSTFAGTRLPSYSYYTQSPQTRIGRKLQSWKLLQSGTTQHVDGIALSVPIIKCSNIQTNRNKSIKCGTPYRKCLSKHCHAHCMQDRQLAPSIDSSWFSVNSVKLPIIACEYFNARSKHIRCGLFA